MSFSAPKLSKPSIYLVNNCLLSGTVMGNPLVKSGFNDQCAFTKS